MTADPRIDRARKYGQNGLVAYLEARHDLDPRPPTVRAAETTATRETCRAERAGVRCIRGLGHTGDHIGPPNLHNPPTVAEVNDAAAAAESEAMA